MIRGLVGNIEGIVVFLDIHSHCAGSADLEGLVGFVLTDKRIQLHLTGGNVIADLRLQGGGVLPCCDLKIHGIGLDGHGSDLGYNAGAAVGIAQLHSQPVSRRINQNGSRGHIGGKSVCIDRLIRIQAAVDRQNIFFRIIDGRIRPVDLHITGGAVEDDVELIHHAGGIRIIIAEGTGKSGIGDLNAIFIHINLQLQAVIRIAAQLKQRHIGVNHLIGIAVAGVQILGTHDGAVSVQCNRTDHIIQALTDREGSLEGNCRIVVLHLIDDELLDQQIPGIRRCRDRQAAGEDAVVADHPTASLSIGNIEIKDIIHLIHDQLILRCYSLLEHFSAGTDECQLRNRSGTVIGICDGNGQVHSTVKVKQFCRQGLGTGCYAHAADHQCQYQNQ